MLALSSLACAIAVSAASIGSTHAGSVLRVQVVDAGGKPCAGVPLDVRALLSPLDLEPAFATTGQDGLAEFADADRFYSAPAQRTVPALSFGIPLAKQDGFALLGQRVPTAPLRLVLPPTACVRVRIVDAEGMDWREPCSATLGWTDRALGVARAWRREFADATAIEFPFVEAGFPCTAAVVDSKGKYITGGSVQATRAGEATTVSLDIPRAGRGIEVQLEGPDAQPLVNELVRVTWDNPATDAWIDEPGTHVVRTDDKGSVFVALPDEERDRRSREASAGAAGADAGFLVLRMAARRAGERPWQTVTLRDRRPLEKGATASRLRMGPETIRAFGTWPHTTPPLYPTPTLSLVERVEDASASNSTHAKRWQKLERARIEIDPAWSFVVRDPDVGGETKETKSYFVLGEFPESVPAFVPVSSISPLFLNPRPPLKAKARVVFDPDVDPAIFEIELVYRAPEPLQSWLETRPDRKPGQGAGVARVSGVRVSGVGAVSWNGLTTGDVLVRVRLAGSPRILREVERRLLPPWSLDESCDLGELDLRGIGAEK